MTLFAALIANMACRAATMSGTAGSQALRPQTERHDSADHAESEKPTVRKILYIGDSMTGWLAESLNAYGRQNGFDVATVVWDGSTIQKWANSPKLASLIKEQNPDAVFVSLGMNELFEAAPEKRLNGSMDKILNAAGDVPVIWVGPPSWPGHKKGEVLNNWLEKKLGPDAFFRSFDLTLPRQGARNPHPTREGMIKWTDALVQWVQQHSKINLPGTVKPAKEKMVRGKTFIYKRMKETL